MNHRIFFFRITSDLIPFASHPICTFPWKEWFASELRNIDEYIRKSEIRISLHPDQFILLNSPDNGIVERSIGELLYHTDIIKLLGLDQTAKFQLHIGGVYGDRERSIRRFVKVATSLQEGVLKHMVVENDEKLYAITDCLQIYKETELPVLLDIFHHTCFNHRENLQELLSHIAHTWQRTDGIPMVDYSSQHPFKRKGSLAKTP